MKEKIKDFLKEHKVEIVVLVGGVILGCIGTRYIWKMVDIRKAKELKKSFEARRIEPEYFETLEGAIGGFKDLSEKCDHPVLFGWLRDKDFNESYGVFDESKLLDL